MGDEEVLLEVLGAPRSCRRSTGPRCSTRRWPRLAHLLDRAKTRCLMSSRSTTTSMIQSHSPSAASRRRSFRPRSAAEALRVEQCRLRLLDVPSPRARTCCEAGIFAVSPCVVSSSPSLGARCRASPPGSGVGEMGGDARAITPAPSTRPFESLSASLHSLASSHSWAGGRFRASGPACRRW